MSDIVRISAEPHWTKQIISSSTHGGFISNLSCCHPDTSKWYWSHISWSQSQPHSPQINFHLLAAPEIEQLRELCALEKAGYFWDWKACLTQSLSENDGNQAPAILEQVPERPRKSLNSLPTHFTRLYIVYIHHTLWCQNVYLIL